MTSPGTRTVDGILRRAPWRTTSTSLHDTHQAYTGSERSDTCASSYQEKASDRRMSTDCLQSALDALSEGSNCSSKLKLEW